jgi:NitT/TauT family transport system permease protein
MSDRLARIAAPLVVGILFLAAWEAFVRLAAVPVYVLPGPLLVGETLWCDGAKLQDGVCLLEGGGLLASLLFTLRLTLAALAAAVVLSGALAILFAQSRLVEISLFPYAVILQVTPILAIAPLIIIWLRDRVFLSLLVCAWIVAFFPVLANTTLGLKSADRNLADLFRLYGASRWQRLRYLQLPTALPFFLAGVRISGGLALVGAVAAEFVAGSGGTETGLAWRILESYYRLQVPRLFAALVLLSATGIAIFAVLSWATRRAIGHWHESALTQEE